MRARPTLQDVSRMAGVSTATVSRVLNSPELVRQDTRAQVQSAIDELGYTPNFSARALASNRTGTVGAVIPTMDNAIFARGIQAMQEELATAGHTLLVATSNYDPQREEEQIHALLGRGVDALALIGEARAPSLHQLLEHRGVPFVLVWAWRAQSQWPLVGFDNRTAAREMAMRVLDMGHRKIGMMAGITHGNDRAADRVTGVREALESRGLTLDETNLVEAAYHPQDGAAAARALLRRNTGLTALICGNDVLAAGAMIAARGLGLTVPDDLSITGFDDIDLAEVLSPPLTTVHVPHRRMGQAAASQILGRCMRDEPLQSVAFETNIAMRSSLAPPPR
ncbi:MAG: LacI family DNA-binding transcriptional regulator [Pseudomonadota bacterium]